MKISYKLFFSIIIVFIVSFIIYGIFAYQRDLNNYIQDIKTDTKTLAKVLSIEFVTVWERDGLSFSLELLDEVNEHSTARIRWVWLDSDNEIRFKPVIDCEKILGQSDRDVSSFINLDEGKFICTYLPVNLPISRTGAIEVYEDLSSVIDTFFINNMVHLGIVALFISICTFILIWVIGYFMLSKRISGILGFIKRLGAGNRSDMIAVKGNDEISTIASGLDAMRTELKSTEEMLMKERDEHIKILEQLRHMDRLAVIGKITSGIAHELGTPLNIISGRAKLLNSFDLSHDEIIENANIIGEQTDNITTIIKNMLNFSRRKKPEKKPVNINTIVRKTIDMFGLNKEYRRVSIELIENEKDIIGNVDRIQIQQVLSNIILNSIQAIPGEGKIEIGVSIVSMTLPGVPAGTVNKTLSLYIKDNGPGIPEADIENVFKPFFTTKSTQGGSGIGLSLVKDIIKDYHGRIEVENNPEGGCCFNIYLPIIGDGS
ncbi:MAG: hypothetical protein JW881_04115 [Spirochaetales bacterium]|nr:hypothetical protein [Spirochaetales bacterium]